MKGKWIFMNCYAYFIFLHVFAKVLNYSQISISFNFRLKYVINSESPYLPAVTALRRIWFLDPCFFRLTEFLHGCCKNRVQNVANFANLISCNLFDRSASEVKDVADMRRLYVRDRNPTLAWEPFNKATLYRMPVIHRADPACGFESKYYYIGE